MKKKLDILVFGDSILNCSKLSGKNKIISIIKKNLKIERLRKIKVKLIGLNGATSKKALYLLKKRKLNKYFSLIIFLQFGINDSWHYKSLAGKPNVKKKEKRQQKIFEVEFVDNKFKDNHLKTIKLNYSKSKFFKKYFDQIEHIYKVEANTNFLLDLNMNLIKFFMKSLGINTKFHKSSDLKIGGKKSEKLANICSFLKQDKYLINVGALNYIENDKKIFTTKGIKLFVQNYKQCEYSQNSSNFLGNASVLDLLFNEGSESISIIRAGRKEDTVLNS